MREHTFTVKQDRNAKVAHDVTVNVAETVAESTFDEARIMLDHVRQRTIDVQRPLRVALGTGTKPGAALNKVAQAAWLVETPRRMSAVDKLTAKFTASGIEAKQARKLAEIATA